MKKINNGKNTELAPEKSAELTALISQAKAEIRARYADVAET